MGNYGVHLKKKLGPRTRRCLVSENVIGVSVLDLVERRGVGGVTGSARDGPSASPALPRCRGWRGLTMAAPRSTAGQGDDRGLAPAEREPQPPVGDRSARGREAR